MNTNIDDNNAIVVENSLTEHHQNQSTTATMTKTIQQAKRKPMNPTPLEYSWWSTHRTETAVGAFGLFISLSIAVGVLIVSLTTPKAAIRKCQLNFKQTVKNPVEYNYDPRSVAVGNFNNDIWLDLVVANRAVDSISVFLGSSNDTFENRGTYSTGSNSALSVVAVGDFNNDQRLDIAVANFGTNSISIFFGLGNGSFENHTTISTGNSRPISIHVADLDSDTFIDIVTADYGTNSISILYGDGNGSFSYRMSYLTGYDSLPISVTSGDFNNDDQIDLAIANYGTNNVGIFLAYGHIKFSDQKTFTTDKNSHPNSIAVGDFNGDQLLDIAVADYGTNNTGVFLNIGNGNFDIQMTFMLRNASPYSIDVGDINKDNRLDLVVANIGTNNIGVLLGYGNGSKGEQTDFKRLKSLEIT